MTNGIPLPEKKLKNLGLLNNKRQKGFDNRLYISKLRREKFVLKKSSPTIDIFKKIKLKIFFRQGFRSTTRRGF